MKERILRIVRTLARQHPGEANTPFREAIDIAHGIARVLTCKSFVQRPSDELWLARYIKILESTVSCGQENEFFIDEPEHVDEAIWRAMIHVHTKAEDDEMKAIRRATDILIASGADAILAELCRVGLYVTEPTEFPELLVA
jgi:hypothetical protein